MRSHEDEFGCKLLGDDAPMMWSDYHANTLVDRLAKEAAEADGLPRQVGGTVVSDGLRLIAIAKW